jgi:Skp family chaperone for outer membrane proteins
VKRTAILALGVLALGTAAYFGNRLWAQTGARPATGPATSAAAPRTRIALLNLSHVIKNYDKFKAYNEDLKQSITPFQKKEVEMKKEAERLVKEKADPRTSAQRKEAVDGEMRALNRKWEDLKGEFNKQMGKKQEQQLVILYGDVRTISERYAQSHNFDLVLHYNDATDPRDYWSGPNVARKMQAGALMPLYYTAGMDISQDVINTLNASYKASQSRPGG